MRGSKVVFTVALLIGLTTLGCGREDTVVSGSPSAENAGGETRAAGPLAQTNGASVDGDQFAKFLDEARSEGYRPATLEEAKRLVGIALVEQIIERERIAKGLAGGTESHEATRRALLMAIGGSVPDLGKVSPAERASREALQRAAFNDQLLAREDVEIDEAGLAKWVNDSMVSVASSPPLPPGMAISESRSR